MIKNSDTHIFYYISLISIFVLGLFLIVYFSPHKDLQMMTLIGVSIAYAFIGVFHHVLLHDLVPKIVIEYVLIAAFGVAAAFFIFKGGFGF